ncbi:GP179 protein, partial [Onychorhynchus coronatus]|nr:GP179 protein [Onychorhynchus coronatus]
CPWEGAEPQLEKGAAPGKDRVLPKEVATSKTVEKGSRDHESICPWEDQEVKSSDKAEICPWEGAEPQLEKGAAPGKDRVPPKEVATSKTVEKGSRDHESICPWESTDTEQPQAKPHAGSTEPSR